MNKTRWIIFIVATFGFLAFLVISTKTPEVDASKIDVNAVQIASEYNGNIADHVYGNLNSKVTLINYGNFQCSACASTHPITKSVVEKYKDKIRFIHRYRTLSYYPNGKAAQATAEAAGLQGKFWEMHDLLYESHDALLNLSGNERTNFFEKLAKKVGLDTKKFLDDLGSEKLNSKMVYDNAVADKAKVNATPTFFLNGTRLEGTVTSDVAKFSEAIDAVLKVSDNTAPTN